MIRTQVFLYEYGLVFPLHYDKLWCTQIAEGRLPPKSCGMKKENLKTTKVSPEIRIVTVLNPELEADQEPPVSIEIWLALR